MESPFDVPPMGSVSSEWYCLMQRNHSFCVQNCTSKKKENKTTVRKQRKAEQGKTGGFEGRNTSFGTFALHGNLPSNPLGFIVPIIYFKIKMQTQNFFEVKLKVRTKGFSLRELQQKLQV